MIRMKSTNLATKDDISRLCSKIWDTTKGFYESWTNKEIISFLDREKVCYNNYFPAYHKTIINYDNVKEKKITIDFCFDDFGNNEYMRLFMCRPDVGGYRWFFSNETTIVNYKDEEFSVQGCIACDLYYWAYSTMELSDIWKRHHVDTIESPMVYGDLYGIRLETKPKEDGSSVRVKLPSKPHKIFKSTNGDSIILLFDKKVSLPISLKGYGSENKMKETEKKQRCIYFYDKILPYNDESLLATYNETKRAIFDTEDAEIKTTQMCFLSTDLIERGFKIFLLDLLGCYEIEYGDFAGITIRKESDLFALWEGGFLVREKGEICRRLISNGDDISYSWLKEQLMASGISKAGSESAIDDIVLQMFREGKICLTHLI